MLLDDAAADRQTEACSAAEARVGRVDLTKALDPTSCQDVSEIFSSIAVDQAGNVYVAYVRRDISQRHPEYDVYVATSSDGGNVFTSHKANTDGGTHYFPWVAAGGNGGVDVVFYDTPYVEGVGASRAASPRGVPGYQLSMRARLH